MIKKSVSNPKNVWNQLLSWLFIQQKEYNKAFIQEKALFKRDPKNIDNILSLGYNSFENKAYDTARNCFDFILKNSPNRTSFNCELIYYKNCHCKNQPNIEQII